MSTKDVLDFSQLDLAQLQVEAHEQGGVDKFEPVSGGSDVDHAEEAVGKQVIASGDGTVDLGVAEHPFDPVALLVERAVLFDFHPAA